MKSLLIASTLLLLCGTADAALPWKTIAELEKDITNSATGICGPDQFITKMQVTKDGVTYIILAVGETRRFVIAELGDDERPRLLYIGRIGEDGKLNIAIQRSFIPGESPCPILYPREVERKP